MNHMDNLSIFWDNYEAHQGRSAKGKKSNLERHFSEGHKKIVLDYFWPENKLRPGLMLTGPLYSN